MDYEAGNDFATFLIFANQYYMPEGKEVEMTDEEMNEEHIDKTAKKYFLNVLDPEKYFDPDASDDMLSVRA